MEIVLILLLIILNALFAMSEMALVSSKKVRLQQIVDKGSIGAAKAISLQEKPEHFISTIQVGITAIGILNGIVGERALAEPTSIFIQNMFGLLPATANTIASVSIIVILTYLSVVFGEIIPKKLGLMLPERIASMLSIPMSWLSKITFPIVWLFTKSSVLILKVFKLDKIEQAPISNEEINDMMVQGADAGVFHESETEIVTNVLHMDEKKVESIMTHRGDFFYIDVKDTYEENIQKMINSSYSKVLVIEGNIDNIIGILHMTNILEPLRKNEEFDFKKYMKTPLFLPETIMATQVLEAFKRDKNEVAIIVNEYGENIGIVTLVDIMETIVGDISVPDEGEEPDFVLREDGSYLVDGLINLDRFAYLMNIDEDDIVVSDNINTLAGLMMEKAGAIPHVSYKCELVIKNCTITLEVMDMDKNCVDKVLIIKECKEEENKEVVQKEV